MFAQIPVITYQTWAADADKSTSAIDDTYKTKKKRSQSKEPTFGIFGLKQRNIRAAGCINYACHSKQGEKSYHYNIQVALFPELTNTRQRIGFSGFQGWRGGGMEYILLPFWWRGAAHTNLLRCSCDAWGVNVMAAQRAHLSSPEISIYIKSVRRAIDYGRASGTPYIYIYEWKITWNYLFKFVLHIMAAMRARCLM